MIKKLLVVLVLVMSIIGCNNDDDGIGGTVVPPRLLSEVAPEDDEEIQEFLQTHFYNYEDFEEPVDPTFDFKIVIDTIEGDNAGKTPLSEQVESVTIDVSAFEFGLNDGEEDIPHTLYYLNARSGVGDNPSVADSVFVRYEGRLLNKTPFDASNTGIWFDLAQLQAPLQGARGFSEGLPFFKSGSIPSVQPSDGTFSVENFGAGVIFMPSGLGFFNSSQGIIPTYAPLLFEINLLAVNEADHDNDGIPSIQEDLNGNGYLYDDNTDQSFEEENRGTLFADLLDIDDDGDGVLTRTEISDAEGNIIFPYPITGGGNVPDYLNPDVQRDPNN